MIQWKRQLSCLILSLAAACPLAEAGKLYKIVDENGKVTFSQFPPTEKSPAAKVESVKVASDGASTINEIDGRRYCGKLMLPEVNGFGTQKNYLTSSIRQSQKYWQDSLDRTTENLERKHRSAGASGRNWDPDDQEELQSIRDLRCAVNWADAQLQEVDARAATTKGERNRLNGLYAQAEQEMIDRCGEKPRLDTNSPYNDQQRSEWYFCTKPHLDKLRKIKSELSLY